MIRTTYLADPHVRTFVDWLSRRLDAPGSFNHRFTLRKTDSQWSCDCLYSAYQRYEWPFSTFDPQSGAPLRGESYQDSRRVLLGITSQLRDALREHDTGRVKDCCAAVLLWGGIRTGNHIASLEPDSVAALRSAAEALARQDLDLDNLPAVPMNSGWTKIYSLLVDGFTMYDSRVAAAFGLLVGQYATEQGLASIPKPLRFCQLPHRATVDRSPSYLASDFGTAVYGSSNHLRSNIMANWVLGACLAARPSRFTADLPALEALTALQSALFMIGYETAPIAAPAPPRSSRPVVTKAHPSQELRPLSGRGEVIRTARLANGWNIIWGSTRFRLHDRQVEEIVQRFFRDADAWYPLGASVTDPPPNGLGAFIQSRFAGLTPRHASAIAALLVREGRLRWRGSKPIELKLAD